MTYIRIDRNILLICNTLFQDFATKKRERENLRNYITNNGHGTEYNKYLINYFFKLKTEN